MDEKLIKYLPIFGIVVAIILLIYVSNRPAETDKNVSGALQNMNNSQTTPLNSIPANQVNNSAQTGSQIMNKNNMPVPSMVIDVNKNYTAVFNTNMGNFKIKLYAKEAPLTVNNFVYLSKNKFYDGLIFHRVIKDFMIQGGDPSGNGTGGPGYRFNDEDSKKPLVKGSLAMANAGPNTNGSQFFIVTAQSTPWLDGKHTNFGEVIEGLDVVDKISVVQTSGMDKPVSDVIINSIEILEN